MIIHFVIDGKLTDQVIDSFLSVSKKNYFLVFGLKEDEIGFKRIKRTGNFIRKFSEKKDDINEVIKFLNAKAIILHSLSYDYAKVILKIKQKITLCWGAWGYDIYGLPKINPNIFAPKTNRYLLKSNPGLWIERQIKKNSFLRKLYFEQVKQKKDPFRVVFEAMSKIDYLVTNIEEDYNILNKYYPNKIKYIDSAFSTLDQHLAGNKDLKISAQARNILLGNSYSASSNHLDAIKFLSKGLDKNNKVYVVLSYGTDEKYKNEVIRYGEKHLGNRFYPLIDFLMREEYLKLLQTCKIGIFYHFRQQALGNIIAMLYMGSRIYLSHKNPAFSYFLRNGIEINSIEYDFKRYGTSGLTTQSIDQNRKRLEILFSEEKVHNNIRSLSEILTRV